MAKHRLTKAQKENLDWLKRTTGLNSKPVAHPKNIDPTLAVLLREGYVKLGRTRNPSKLKEIVLTDKGKAAIK